MTLLSLSDEEAESIRRVYQQRDSYSNSFVKASNDAAKLRVEVYANEVLLENITEQREIDARIFDAQLSEQKAESARRGTIVALVSFIGGVIANILLGL